MFEPDKYLSVTWLKGGRVYPQLDCFGIVNEIRRDLGLPEWPDFAGVTKDGGGLDKEARKLMLKLERCEPCVGAGVACYSGTMVTHVGIVVELNGLVTIIAPTNYLISSSSGYSVLFSDTLTKINPYAGMPVTLEINGAEYDLFIATFTPKQDAVPGVGGSAASLRGSAAPTTYDFSTSSQTFTLTWQATTYTVSLIANYGNMSGLLAAINEAISESNLVAQDDGGVVRIVEKSSPWLGGSITASSLPVSVFGDSPVFTDGTASSGGSPAITANVTLAYGSGSGAAFSGIPEEAIS
ncbi:hypothetical protein AF48_01888 [Klebsiella aerogenes MGH 62]|nr:hypothetical protein AF48_01888 [Klebsiella aerogenes MGH 62]